MNVNQGEDPSTDPELNFLVICSQISFLNQLVDSALSLQVREQSVAVPTALFTGLLVQQTKISRASRTFCVSDFTLCDSVSNPNY